MRVEWVELRKSKVDGMIVRREEKSPAVILIVLSQYNFFPPRDILGEDEGGEK
jgi:hypothetical protein